MKKTLLLFITFSLITVAVKAQDFSYGIFTQEDMAMKSYDKDTSAHAVVLDEFGKSRIDVTSDDRVKLIYEYHVKIKIFDSEGFNEGKIEIPIYNNDETYESVEDLKGITTYTDENGLIKTIELDPSKIYKTKDNKHWSELKFAMPGIRNGCTIEYSYTLYSSFFENFHSWEFQSNIPKVHSEYDVHIPAFWNYNALMRGGLKLTTNVAVIEKDCFSSAGAKCDCSHFTYGMKDIPAFIEEADMTAPKNFISGIYFELSDYTNPYDNTKHVMSKEWKDVDYELKHSSDFGGQIRKRDFFKDKITPLIAGKTDDIDKAKTIYRYIQKNVKWSDFYAIESEDGVRKAITTHTGNVAEINLSLVAALDAAGLTAEPVLISTREHGIINRLYPTLTDFNYVIAKVDIGDKSYLLDGTDALLGFGMLPERCMNDQGRVMYPNKASEWIDLNNSQTQIQKSTYTLDLTLQSDGKIKGTMTHYAMGYEGYEDRKAIKKFNSVDEYVESLDEKSTKFRILKSDISYLDSLDMPLVEKYEIEIKEFSNMDHDELGFNPFITDHMTINPFKLAERTYPVDWGMPSVTRYTLTVHLPDNFSIAGNPPDVGVSLPNNGGSFLTQFVANDNSFTFSHVLQLNKAIYTPEEYPYLKELFNKIILSEKSKIVFKKKS